MRKVPFFDHKTKTENCHCWTDINEVNTDMVTDKEEISEICHVIGVGSWYRKEI